MENVNTVQVKYDGKELMRKPEEILGGIRWRGDRKDVMQEGEGDKEAKKEEGGTHGKEEKEREGGHLKQYHLHLPHSISHLPSMLMPNNLNTSFSSFLLCFLLLSPHFLPSSFLKCFPDTLTL